MTSNVLSAQEIFDYLKTYQPAIFSRFSGVSRIIDLNSDNMDDIMPLVINRNTRDPTSFVFLLSADNNPDAVGHFVCVYKRPRSQQWMYFDSLGFPMPEVLAKKFPNLEYVPRIFQDIKGDQCGLFCLKKIISSQGKT